MTKNHLKTRSAPRTWNIARKVNTFITRPNPGSQKIEMTLPLDTFLRVTNVASTKKEINYVIKTSEVLVNGKRRWDRRYGIGFMDVVSFPTLKKHFILSLDEQGKLAPESVDEKHASTKLVQVTGANKVAGGKLQLHFSDGRNILADKSLQRGSTAAIEIPDNKIKTVYAVEPKAHVILTSGKHRGSKGTIEAIDGEFITVATKAGSISTKKAYAFVLGGKA